MPFVWINQAGCIMCMFICFMVVSTLLSGMMDSYASSLWLLIMVEEKLYVVFWLDDLGGSQV